MSCTCSAASRCWAPRWRRRLPRDGPQRRLQFGADARQEFALGLVGALHRAHQFLQAPRQRLLFQPYLDGPGHQAVELARRAVEQADEHQRGHPHHQAVGAAQLPPVAQPLERRRTHGGQQEGAVGAAHVAHERRAAAGQAVHRAHRQHREQGLVDGHDAGRQQAPAQAGEHEGDEIPECITLVGRLVVRLGGQARIAPHHPRAQRREQQHHHRPPDQHALRHHLHQHQEHCRDQRRGGEHGAGHHLEDHAQLLAERLRRQVGGRSFGSGGTGVLDQIGRGPAA